MRFVKQFGAVAIVAFVTSLAVTAVDGSWILTLVLGFAAAALLLLTYRWVVGRTERRETVELARAGAGAAIGRGLVIGLLMFGSVIANIAFLDGYRVDGWGSVTAAVGFLGFTAAAVMTEELIFRGILFRLIEERIGTWIALGITSLLFGASHLANPDASLWGATAIAIEAGAMLAAAYAATRTLWVPIGVHFGWNFAAGGIFGAEVSGNGTSKGLLEGVTSGSTALTGGDFGPEGSVYAVLAGALLTVAFLWLAHRRGNIVPGRRSAARSASTATL